MSSSARGARRLLLCTAACCAALATPVSAQDTPVGDTFLGRIIFGAGRAKVAIDTPQAVTALEQGDIDREQASNAGQLFRNVPGVQTAGSDRPLGFAFNIRGIGATEQSASEARIIVNIDGVPKFYEQYRLGSLFTEPELLKRVEVLRGPASATLYGSGAIGGVVNFETRDAGDFLADGDKGAVRLKFGLDSNGKGRVASGILALRPSEGHEFLAALGYRTSDEAEDGAGDPLPGSNGASVSGLLKGTFALNDRQTLRLSVQTWESDEEDATLAQTGGSVTTPAFGLVDRRVRDTTVSAVWQATTDSAWLNPKVQLSYSDTSVRQRDATDFAGVPQPCFPFASNVNVFCDVDYSYRTTMLKAENTASLQGTGWEAFLTAGVQLTDQDRVTNSPGVLNFQPGGNDRKIGVYAQGEIVLGDRLTIIPGARIDVGKRRPDADIPGGEEVSDSAKALTLAAMFKVTDDLSVFGSLARTERLPTLDELYSYSATKGPALDLDREVATNIELGVAFQREDVFRSGDSLQVKATAFRNRIDDLIAVTAPTDTTFFANQSDADFWGGEIEAGYETERFLARLAYANIRGQDRTFDYTPATVPAENLALTLGYRFPERGIEVGWRGTFVDATKTGTRSATTGLITETSYGNHDIHDFYVSWQPEGGALDGFDVQFAVENAFDEDYRNNLALDRGRGRTFKLSVAKALTW